ncbi:MAG TPA: hypothetical protein VHX63_16625 [Acidobacteriaceae bacterium]|jgi:hypothetical protein|nr:hypothetical protein [Acidobacteriaceae bacterium]
MQQSYDWSWVEAQVAQTIEVWHDSAAPSLQGGAHYDRKEQQQRENAYDEGLLAVERAVRKTPRTKAQRLETQDRITASFAQFSATALGLQGDAVHLLTNDFLPVGRKLAQWARQFDAGLSMPDIIQACRNAWTACGLQPLLGDRIAITPAILGYSLLYPYSDNYLDRTDVSAEEKRQFSRRFRDRLRGERLAAQGDRELAMWALVALIEEQYPRLHYPQVFDCLLAIHRAQEESIRQLEGCGQDDDAEVVAEVLRMSCAKGGSSVLADACLAHGWLSEEESRFSFEWGVLLQLGDDLQDVREDMQRGSITLFSRAAALGTPLDSLVIQLLNFSERVGARMDNLPHATPMLKELLKMSWRSLIIGAVADSHEFFSPGFLSEAELSSPFRFEFLRARRERLSNRQGLYAVLFDAFLEAREGDDGDLPLAIVRNANISRNGRKRHAETHPHRAAMRRL